MPTNLTVILRAGASFDTVNPQSTDLLKDRHGLRFRPPVTANLFNTHEEWAEEYKKFPAVASLVQELRQELPEKHTSVNVEEFLRSLKESSKIHRNNQFRQLPLYLQHYFYKISTNYCKWPANYSIGESGWVWSSFRIDLEIDNYNNDQPDYITVGLRAKNNDGWWNANHFIFQIENTNKRKHDQPLLIEAKEIKRIGVLISDTEVGSQGQRQMPDIDMDTLELIIKTRSNQNLCISIKGGWITKG